MNDEKKAKLFIAGKLTIKAMPLIIIVSLLACAVGTSDMLRTATDRYKESLAALKELAEAGAVQPEIVGAFEGLAGIMISLFLLMFILVTIMLRRRRRRKIRALKNGDHGAEPRIW